MIACFIRSEYCNCSFAARNDTMVRTRSQRKSYIHRWDATGSMTHIGVHAQRVLEVGSEKLVQRVGRGEAALRGDDVGLNAGVRPEVVRHQLVICAVQTAEGRLHHLPNLHSIDTGGLRVRVRVRVGVRVRFRVRVSVGVRVSFGVYLCLSACDAPHAGDLSRLVRMHIADADSLCICWWSSVAGVLPLVSRPRPTISAEIKRKPEPRLRPWSTR